MARPLWFVEILKKTYPNVKLIAKMTKIPIIGKIFNLLMFEEDNLIFLPRDQTIQVNVKLDSPTDIVLPSQIVKSFINRASHHFIMNFCICRESLQCNDYPTDMGCLFLGEPTLQINPQLGKPVSKEEALKYISKCQEKGLTHVIGRNKLDAQWLGVKPGEKLLTICNCCPCCCLYRIIPHLNSKISAKMQKLPGIEVRVGEKCIGCGTCTRGTCFVEAIKLVGKKAVISDECRGCGRCVDKCPQQAIEITLDDRHFTDKAITQIKKAVDVS